MSKYNNLFLENNEGKIHANAKRKLFKLLIEHKIHLLDDSGYEYIIFPQENPTEFLHMEAFTVNYLNNAIYSDSEMSCFENFNLIHENTYSYCNGVPEYRICWELPCRKCIEHSYSSIKDIKPIGYTPDIAYGYDNKYKIWIEICNTHPATSNKIEFCIKNNIILLEVSAYDIELLDSSFLMIINRTSNNYWNAVNKISEIESNNKVLKVFEEQFNSILKNIKIKGYSLYSEYANEASNCILGIHTSGFQKYLEERGVKAMQLSKIKKEKYNVTEDGFPWIVVSSMNQ